MHTKKTNNTNKLIQISYHSALTKIQKLQNLKKKKKKIVPTSIARNWLVWPVFFPVQNKGVIRIGFLAGTVYSGRTGRYGMKLTPLITLKIQSPCTKLFDTSDLFMNGENYYGKIPPGDFKVVTPKNPLLLITSSYKYKESYQTLWPIPKYQPTIQPLPQYPIGLVL